MIHVYVLVEATFASSVLSSFDIPLAVGSWNSSIPLVVGAWSSNIPLVVGAWSSNIPLVVGA